VSDREGHFALLLDMLTATCTAEELQELGEELLRRAGGEPSEPGGEEEEDDEE
jgi:hypothetical protein